MKNATAHLQSVTMRRPDLWRRLTALTLLVVAIFDAVVAAQSLPRHSAISNREDRPLVDRDPYDVITLNEANRGVSVNVMPLTLAGGKVPNDPEPNSTVRARLYENDEKEYEIYWRDIDKIELFGQLLIREAERLSKARDFDVAYRCYSRLFAEYPHQPQLDSSFDQFLYAEGTSLIRDRNYSAALNSLEALRLRNPGYRPPDSEAALNDIVNRLVDRVTETYFEEGNLRAARAIVSRIRSSQPSNVPRSIQRWEQRFAELAADKLDAARAALAREDFHEARLRLKEMIEIWPAVPGGAELEAELAARYSVLMVGVLQPLGQPHAMELGSWPNRRTASLLQTPFIGFDGVGAEGGRYRFSLGMVEQTDDRRGLIFRIAPQAVAQGWTGYEVGDRLAEFATPASPEYRPTWAALLEALEIPSINQVRAELRHSHVLPHALLCSPLANSAAAEFDSEIAGDGGPYYIAEQSESLVRFRPSEAKATRGIAEIVEQTFANSRQALAALRNGEIDVVDRLFPADAARLRRELGPSASIEVEPYLLPSVHMLLINESNPFLANSDFRRALVYGIDRDNLLRAELLGGEDLPGCQLLSGPFPIGTGDRDPLAYAYDQSIAARPYTPQLAKLLALIAHDAVSSKGHTWRPLTIGFPPNEMARVTCVAIAGQLAAVGIETELKAVDASSRPGEAAVDLLYAEIVMREPLVDADRLLGMNGLARTSDPSVRFALRQLHQAQNWSAVREGLLKIHRAVHDEVIIVPLWQTVDYFAFNRRLRNLSDRPLSLYQQIDQWRIGSREGAE